MTRTVLIPSSIQRVRSFLNREGRMKVRPWAGAGETLDALHATLARRREDDEFWRDLEALLETLSRDMARRLRTGPGLVDNEVLDHSRHHELLDEIRRAMLGVSARCGGFRLLASSLTVPAMGLLALLGGAVTAGCGSTIDLAGDADASEEFVLDSRDTPADRSDPHEDLADPPVDPAPEEPCIHDGKTLTQIIDECVETEERREQILDCVAALHESWSAGLRQFLLCMDCGEVSEEIHLCFELGGSPVSYCSHPEDVEEFDLETFLDNCATYIYIGVRFE